MLSTATIASPASGSAQTARSASPAVPARFRRKPALRLVTDAASVAIAVVAYAAGILVAVQAGAPVPGETARALFAAAVLMLLTDRLTRDGSAHLPPVRAALIALTSASLAALAAGIDLLWVSWEKGPAWALAAFVASAAAASALLRAIAARTRVHTALRPRLAIYGATDKAVSLRAALGRRTSYTFVGLFDDRARGRTQSTAAIGTDGRLEDLIRLAMSGDIDEIVIALPAQATARIAELATRLQPFPVKILAPLDIATQVVTSDSTARIVDRLVTISDCHLVVCRAAPFGEWGGLAKSIFDRACAAVLLAVLSPLFLLIAVALKLDSAGPVFFRQRRHGIAGESIMVWKFRTMRVLEDGANIRQATKNDPRITRVGAFLRKSSLDELPQLINVLLGSMSLVGPRPHAVAHNEHYGVLIASYDCRCRVRPGITGLAQINGYRGETRTTGEMAGRVAHDIWYVSNWSFWLDLKILLLTPIYGFVHKHAY